MPGLVTVAWQLTDLKSLGIREVDAAKEVQYVDALGRVSSGAQGIARMFVSRGGLVALLGRFMLLPGIRTVAAMIYKLVSENRHRLPGGTPACKMTPPGSDA